MSLPRTVSEILREHVTLETEGIDRMYLNVYVPILQREQGISWFFRAHRGHAFASSALMAPITKAFVAKIEAFADLGPSTDSRPRMRRRWHAARPSLPPPRKM